MKNYVDKKLLESDVILALNRLCNSTHKAFETRNLTQVSGNEECFLIGMFQINVNLFQELLIKNNGDKNAFIACYKIHESNFAVNCLKTQKYDLCTEIQNFLKKTDTNSRQYSDFSKILSILRQLTSTKLTIENLYNSNIADIINNCTKIANAYPKFYIRSKIQSISRDLNNFLMYCDKQDMKIEFGQANFHVYRNFQEEIKYPTNSILFIPTIECNDPQTMHKIRYFFNFTEKSIMLRKNKNTTIISIMCRCIYYDMRLR